MRIDEMMAKKRTVPKLDRYCDHGESTDFPPQVITGFQMFYVHLGEYATCRPPNKIIDMFTKIW